MYLDVLKVDHISAIVNRTYLCIPTYTYPKSLKVQGVSIPQWLQCSCLSCLMHGEMVLISRACFCLGIYAACFLWPICKSPHHWRDRPCSSDMNLGYFLAGIYYVCAAVYVFYFANIHICEHNSVHSSCIFLLVFSYKDTKLQKHNFPPNTILFTGLPFLPGI